MPSKTLHYQNPRHLHQLYCGREDNLLAVETAFNVKLATREDWLKVDGADADIARVEGFFTFLNEGRQQGLALRNSDFTQLLDGFVRGDGAQMRSLLSEPLVIATNRRSIVPKTIGQKLYLQSIQKNSIVFGIGPAGTGKTYLAVAAAISAVLKNQVQRVVLTRPAVEAGEALGFLPGDLREKILPYLRPLYDAMNDMLDAEDVARLVEKGVIEIAPLAYMRGRTLSDAFIILDEAQNTTPEQMMMFLTRLGDESRMVVTGDITQIDLPRSEAVGSAPGEAHPERHCRNRLSLFHRRRRRAPPARPEDHRGLRALPASHHLGPRGGGGDLGASRPRRPCRFSPSSSLLRGGSAAPRRRRRKSVHPSVAADYLQQSRPVAFLIFVATVAAIVLISFVGVSSATLPVLPNQLAMVRIVASAPFTLRSKLKTELSREQLLNRVPPVYQLEFGRCSNSKPTSTSCSPPSTTRARLSGQRRRRLRHAGRVLALGPAHGGTHLPRRGVQRQGSLPRFPRRRGRAACAR